jgi:hypothetical protein
MGATRRRALLVLACLVAIGVVALLVAYAGRSHLEAPVVQGVNCPDPYRATIGSLALPVAFDGGRVRLSNPPSHPAPAVSRATALVDFESSAEIAGVHSCVGFGLASLTLTPTGTGFDSQVHRLTWVGIAHNQPLPCGAATGARSSRSVSAAVDVVLIDAEETGWVDIYTTRSLSCSGVAYGPTLTAAHQVVSVPFETTIRDGGYYVYYIEPTCSDRGLPQSDGPLPSTIVEIDVAVPFGTCASTHLWTVQPRMGVAGPVRVPVGPKVVLEP